MLKFVAITILSLCNGWTKSETYSEISATATERSDLAFAEFAKHFPGISATVFVGRDQVWSAQHGFADLATETLLSENTRINIYSTSKALIGFAFARLVNDGVISLDLSVEDLAPDLPEHFHPIRIRDLLSHTSGIRHYNSPQDWLAFAQLHCKNPAEAIGYFGSDALLHEPGLNTTYSTFAFVLASELLLRITGEEKFEDALNHTLGPWANFKLDQIDANKASMYIKAGRLPQSPPNTTPDDIVALPSISAECKFGGGGLISTSSELARAGAALCLGEIIPMEKLSEGLQPWSDVTSVIYGGAIGHHNTPSAAYHSYSLSGGAPGGRSYLLALIEPQISVAIAGNIEGPNMSDLAWKIGESWLELQAQNTSSAE